MVILGIETSCDETAAAVVEDGRKLLSNVVASSVDLHAAFGGVVPEIAARSHLEIIIPVINQALREAFVPNAEKEGRSKEKGGSNLPTSYSLLPTPQFDLWDQIDAIAVTQGPGLLGSLLIGVLTARTLAVAKQKPLYAVNHVHAHPYAAFLTSHRVRPYRSYELPEQQPEFPFLALIVSGGHSQLVLFHSHKKYRLLGQTTDDAVGEAYDKVAKMLGLPYPGGPSIDKAAQKGDPSKYPLPIAKMENPYDFSFSGLKTAVLRLAQAQSGHDYTFPSTKLPKALSEAQKADIAASFQRVAVETLVESLKRAEEEFQPKSIVVAGGVAANQELRKQIFKEFKNATASRPGLVAVAGYKPEIFFPDTKLCTDNAAMVAVLACYQQRLADPYFLEPDPGLRM